MPCGALSVCWGWPADAIWISEDNFKIGREDPWLG